MIKPLSIREVQELFEQAFSAAYLNNADAPRIQERWMRVALLSESFRMTAQVATTKIRSRRGDPIPDPVDSAFLRGVAMGLMVGCKIRDDQAGHGDGTEENKPTTEKGR